MSVFGKMFRGRKNDGPQTTQSPIEKLYEMEDMLTRRKDFLEEKITGELENAKKYGTKNKRAALAALKRKKRYELQVQQVYGTLSAIERQREALEGTTTSRVVLATLGQASKALKAAQKNTDVDE
ncbi:unnamed protein product, partial [Darwinula stevensoni]